MNGEEQNTENGSNGSGHVVAGTIPIDLSPAPAVPPPAPSGVAGLAAAVESGASQLQQGVAFAHKGAAMARVMEAVMHNQQPTLADVASALGRPLPTGVGTGTGVPQDAPIGSVPPDPRPTAPMVPIQRVVATRPAVRRAPVEQPAPAAPPRKAPLDQVLNRVGRRMHNALGSMLPGCGLSITLYADPDGEGVVYHSAVIIPPDDADPEITTLSETKGGPDNLGDIVLLAFQQAREEIAGVEDSVGG